MRSYHFNFNYKKATQALDYVAEKSGGTINRLKALKLIYFADKYHLRKYGRLITNDTYFAMDNGPVASGAKDLAEESDFSGREAQNYASKYIESSTKYDFVSKKPTDKAEMSPSDLEALDYAWDKFGGLDEWGIVDLTHKYPDWYKHKVALKTLDRVQMDLYDFLDDSADFPQVDKCFELTDKDRGIRREQLEEMLSLESIWR
ncbi:MAG: Panacea domain-containing protein [Dehalococcoidia bacterium]